jgi:hypothetical protein
MPTDSIEVENTTDMSSGFLKFILLSAFHYTFRIVARLARKPEFESKIARPAFNSISNRTRLANFDLVSAMHTKESDVVALHQEWAVRVFRVVRG